MPDNATPHPPAQRRGPNPAEHKSRRPRPCNAERCCCKWLLFHANRANSKLKKGGAGE